MRARQWVRLVNVVGILDVMRAGYLILAVVASAALLAACGGESVPAPEEPIAAVPAPTVEQLPAPYNAASLEAGQAAFGKKCAGCHFLDRAKGDMVGPNLHGMFERGPGHSRTYKAYSPVLKDLGGDVWDPAVLDQWLTNPRAFLPGSSMFFNGIADVVERRDLIAFLMVQSRK